MVRGTLLQPACATAGQLLTGHLVEFQCSGQQPSWLQVVSVVANTRQQVVTVKPGNWLSLQGADQQVHSQLANVGKRHGRLQVDKKVK
jgi:hypothetical protein